MKTISAELAEHFAGATTRAVCLRIDRTDGEVFAATNNDVDLIITESDDSPPEMVTYLSRSGGTDSDVQTSNALNVDTADQLGVLSLDSITDDDIRAGLYNDAVFSLFVVNYEDLSQGKYHLLNGKIGRISTNRGTFTAELQGMMDAFKRSFGKLVLPICPYNLGDLPFPGPYRGRCRVDLSGGTSDSPPIPFTVTGTIESASDDGRTMFDSARTEPGPSGSVNIVSISNSNPCVIVTDAPVGPEGSTVTLSAIVGPEALNTVWVVRNPSGNQFEIIQDTSDTAQFPAYGGGGVATPLGSESGWFDYGWIRIDDNGDSPPSKNVGIVREVKSYVPGQWTLQQEFPYPVLGGEAYTMVVGCDHTAPTCKAKFDNLNNFGAFPFVPGQDKAIQVAQPQSGQSSGGKK